MRILLSSDDGINAPGLEVLEEIARELSDDVWIVAPETEQSGAAHSLSMHHPVRLRQLGDRRFAVSGTPTDSVLMAMKVILKERGEKAPDLLLSGVNRGSNLGEDVTYSGTVAAAMEGTLLGLPSIAMSQCFVDNQPIQWETAVHYGADVVRKLLDVKDWSNGTLMNVNFPNCGITDVKGMKIAPQGLRSVGENIVTGCDPRGKPYYWIGGSNRHSFNIPNSDIEACNNGFIAITPISLDLTDYKMLGQMVL